MLQSASAGDVARAVTRASGEKKLHRPKRWRSRIVPPEVQPSSANLLRHAADGVGQHCRRLRADEGVALGEDEGRNPRHADICWRAWSVGPGLRHVLLGVEQLADLFRR